MLTDSQKQLMHDFTERSYSSIRFMEPRTTLDTTSRYVDRDKKDQTQEKARQDVDSGNAATIEQKLKVLKDLYDKNLITKEDYEKKKVEILKDL
jgi:actin-related protein